MGRAVKWVITLGAGAGVFALGWLACDIWIGMDAGTALAIAAVPSALVTAPLTWWAGREPAPLTSPATPATTTNTAEDARDVVQAGRIRDIGSIGGQHVGSIGRVDRIVINTGQRAAPVAPVAGQVVVGPVPREPQHFQTPTDTIDRLAALAGTGSLAVVCAVTGQRGVGKTQAAGAYARQRIADGWTVAWIPAEDADLVLGGLADLADALGLRQPEDTAAVMTARVRAHLQTLRGRALLVFDNVTDPDQVTPHLPAAGGAQIVLTSASRDTDQVGTRVVVELFDPGTAVRFLTSSTGIDDEAGAREVAHELGYLPLALAQAAARIQRIDRDFATYLRNHRALPISTLLTARPGAPYPQGAAEAILLALSPFVTPGNSPHAAALALLDLLSVLSPDGVSRDLLATLHKTDTSTTQNPGPVGDVLALLFDASLVEYAGTEQDVVVTHRLTQRVLRDRATHDLTATLHRAAHLLDQATFSEHLAWQQRDLGDELIRHIDTLWQHAHMSPKTDLNIILKLRTWSVRQLTKSASLDRAIHLAATVHADAHRALGGNHPDTLASANNLAGAYESAGRLDEAVVLFERTLVDRRRVLGDNHPDTLISVNNLAYAYELVGRLDEAVVLFERTLVDRRRVLGDNHPDTLISVNNLAYAYELVGRLDDAVVLFERTLVDRRRVLGDNHPDTLASVNNLAGAYTLVGRLDEAIVLFEQALTDTRRVLGVSHPGTLASVNNLAYAYELVGRLDEAVVLFERTLVDRRRVLGDNHPDTLISVNNLAYAYTLVGRLDEAVVLFERTLVDRRRVLGDNHPSTLASVSNLAHAYRLAGRVDEASTLVEQTDKTTTANYRSSTD